MQTFHERYSEALNDGPGEAVQDQTLDAIFANASAKQRERMAAKLVALNAELAERDAEIADLKAQHAEYVAGLGDAARKIADLESQLAGCRQYNGTQKALINDLKAKLAKKV